MESPLAGKVFRAPTAHLTRAQLRSAAWRRLHRTAYADASLTPTHGLRCAAAHVVIPTEAAVGLRSAAWMFGVTLHPDDAPVDIVVPRGHRIRRVTGMRVHLTDLPPDDVVPGIPNLTSPGRTAWDLARFLPIPDSLPYLDQFVAQRLVSVSALRKRLDASTVAWGRKRAHQAIELIDPRAESPQESRLRAVLIIKGLPRPEVQHTVRHRGRFIARVDLAWPERRLAVEYDGLWHWDIRQFHADRRRLNALVNAGWRVLHVTSARLARDPDKVVAEIRAALAHPH